MRSTFIGHYFFFRALIVGKAPTHQALLGAFDEGYGVEEVDEDALNASQGKWKSKRSANYMKTGGIALVKAWESVSLDAITSNEPTIKPGRSIAKH
jgi:hypothetical protein